MNRRNFFKMTFISSMTFHTSAIWAENKYDRFPYPRLWRNQSIEKAIFELFGDVAMVKNKNISIEAPSVCSNGGSVPCKLNSKLDLQRVALFIEDSYSSYGGKRAGLVAIWTIPEDQILNYSFRIKIYSRAKLKVVAETRNGDFIYTSTESEAVRGGIGG